MSENDVEEVPGVETDPVESIPKKATRSKKSKPKPRMTPEEISSRYQEHLRRINQGGK